METLAQEALRLISEVPADKFLTNLFTNEVDSCCVVGHYMRLKSANPQDYSAKNTNDVFFGDGLGCDLRLASQAFLKKFDDGSPFYQYDIANVNNNNYRIEPYTESEPKDRVIHLLKDMVEAGL